MEHNSNGNPVTPGERRPIPGMEGFYDVCSNGHVYSLKRKFVPKERLLSQYDDRDGYMMVCLRPPGPKLTTGVHRLMGIAFGLVDANDPHQTVDHKDTNKQNNLLSNLRRASRRQQQMHGGALRKNNKSGYRGVSRRREGGKWTAQIRNKGKKKHLGLFTCKIEAAKAYDAAAREMFGEWANCNFPEEDNK